jgi:hypothetical protein
LASVARREPPPIVEVAKRRHLVASELGVAVRVVAREDGAPLTAARVSIDGAEGDPGRFSGDEDARFVHTFSEAGTFTLLVEHDGRAPERLRIKTPHRGEWSDALVRLETTRAYARRAIDVVARAAAVDEDKAETLTVREAEAELVPGEDTAFVVDTESLVYGAESPDLGAARAIVARGNDRAANPHRP